jgi:hypothetical protein
MRTYCLVAAILAAVCLPALVEAGGRSNAKKGFASVVEIAGGNDEKLLEEVFPKALVRGRSADDVKTWREGFARKLAAAKVLKVTQAGDHAVARFQDRGSENELSVLLRAENSRWILACADPFLLKGELLDKANGSGPASVALARRKGKLPYDGSAFSLAHVTKNPDICKNRMDLWLCRYGDLHTVKDNRIARVGKRKLDKVDALDPALEWAGALPAVKGHTYVIRCFHVGRKDFFVKARVASVGRTKLSLEWSLLATGHGSPPSIHEEYPLRNCLDGADGNDGVCFEAVADGKKRKKRR